MQRITLLLAVLVLLAPPATAISEFHRQWKDHYLINNNAGFVLTARKAGCYICHVKGEPKEEVRNEYGSALSKYLEAEDFPVSWVKANPEEARSRIVAAFKKAEEDSSKDKRKFGAKIKNGDLPAIDSGL